MNYQEYRKIREDYLTKHSPLRLDCMNPVKSFSFLIKESEPHPTATMDQVVKKWAELNGLSRHTERYAVASGVRALLASVFAVEKTRDALALLPEDVYPVYWDLAGSAGLRAQSYQTFPRLDLSALENQPVTLLLIPNPLVPAGGTLTDNETEKILRWLKASPNRRVVIDGVYQFGSQPHKTTLKLITTGQCYYLHSLAKSWLLPDCFGVAILPQATTLPSQVENSDLGRAFSRLNSQPNLPAQMQALFDAQWKKLSAQIKRIDPSWEAPKTGYFSTIRATFETLLKRNIMAVPSSVFDSNAKDITVITCLYYGAGNPPEGSR